MNDRIEIFHVPFDAVDLLEAVKRVKVLKNSTQCHHIITANTEFVMTAQEDGEFLKIIKNAHLVIPDGIGVVWASKYFGQKLPERVAGYDLVKAIFADGEPFKIFLLGGGEGVAKEAGDRIKASYPHIEIGGTHSGFFSDDDTNKIIEGMEGCHILLVGMGAPKQEKWIYRNLNNIPVNIAIGVGGTLDILAGKKERAPLAFQRLGLEWFYRLLKEPKRFFRMLSIPKFIFKVLLYRIETQKN